MKKRHPIFLRIMVALAVILVVFSVLVASCCIKHKCIGAECPVCLRVSLSKRLMEGLAVPGAGSLLYAAVLLWLLHALLCTGEMLPATLITMKVKLSN